MNHFTSIDEAYKNRGIFLSIASKLKAQYGYSFNVEDIVQDMFVDLMEWVNKNPSRVISKNVMILNLKLSCRRYNNNG